MTAGFLLVSLSTCLYTCVVAICQINIFFLPKHFKNVRYKITTEEKIAYNFFIKNLVSYDDWFDYRKWINEKLMLSGSSSLVVSWNISHTKIEIYFSTSSFYHSFDMIQVKTGTLPDTLFLMNLKIYIFANHFIFYKKKIYSHFYFFHAKPPFSLM